MAPPRTAPRPPTAEAPPADLQDQPVDTLKNVGAQVAAVLRAHGFETVGDVLSLTPRRYLDLREADDWRRVRHGQPGILVAVEGVIADARGVGPPRARRLQIALREPQGVTVLRAVFFHAKSGMGARLPVGATVRLLGTLRRGPLGPELVQPKVLAAHSRTKPIEPVYPAIGSIAPGNVARIVQAALSLVDRWADPVPAADAAALGLLPAPVALRRLHAPDATVGAAELHALVEGRAAPHRRLGLEELLALSTALERARRSAGGALPIAADAGGVAHIEGRLGLTLTQGQRDAVSVLLGDMAGASPMRRLLVGDVGSGKTAVALAATLAVLRAGGAVSWLCPTTLVAEQHARVLEKALGGEGGPVAVLLGSTPTRARRHAEKVIAAGLVRLVVGTHTILDAALTPPSLGLVVIDEQHRFGVAQRLAMVAGRSPSPHLLVVSATPIPRTLALAQYGDLDVVTLSERPAGRQEVATRLVEPGDRAFVLRTIARALEADGRVFVVAPRIDAETAEEGDDDDEVRPPGGASVADTLPWLTEALGAERVAVVHGRLPADAQREALDAFRRGVQPVLLGTTVVEVGLDVPAANLMVILGAEHFGVAQLHQLRGRVGRGGQRAGCLLVPDAAATEADPDAHTRLAEVAACSDGFVLAERDLARRGAGEWFGARQSGADSTLRFADPVRDADLVRAARDIARRVVAADPSLAAHPVLARAVRRLLHRGAAPVGEEAG